MSQLKYKLKVLLPELKEEAKQIECKDAKRRYQDLKYIANSSKSVELACRHRQVSRDYFEKWTKKLLQMRSLIALVSGSRRPLKSPNKTSTRTENRILKFREENPFMGAEMIKFNLNLKQSSRTVHNILKRLGLISKAYRKRMTKRHNKRYRRPFPGYLQMDFKYVPFLIHGKQYYQLSCVDHHSSWRMIRMYPTKCRQVVRQFLDELIELCPFPIIQMQTDNDVAFTNKFVAKPSLAATIHPMNVWRDKHDIEHRLIPVGEKELNGKVENTHRQDDREFFAWINPGSLEELRAMSRAYERRWNNERATKTLNWLTPVQTLELANVRALAFLKFLKEKCQKKSKRKSQVNRYLTWLKADDQKYGKWIILMPTMSLRSSDVFGLNAGFCHS